jgi:UDP-2-acetamido-3-amino-2,3-dideoxy-glucuronate N-acetyltransferase
MNTDASRSEVPARIMRDDRGVLGAMEFFDVPFVPRRFFWLTAIEQGQTRAGHAHRTCEQFLIALEGSVVAKVWSVDQVTESRTLHLGDTLYLPPYHWLELSNFSPGAVLGVLASAPYDPTEYITDEQELRSHPS